MTRDEHKKSVQDYIDKVQVPNINEFSLGELLYTMSELRLFPDGVDSVSIEQALLCWQIVQQNIHNTPFPDELRM